MPPTILRVLAQTAELDGMSRGRREAMGGDEDFRPGAWNRRSRHSGSPGARQPPSTLRELPMNLLSPKAPDFTPGVAAHIGAHDFNTASPEFIPGATGYDVATDWEAQTRYTPDALLAHRLQPACKSPAKPLRDAPLRAKAGLAAAGLDKEGKHPIVTNLLRQNVKVPEEVRNGVQLYSRARKQRLQYLFGRDVFQTAMGKLTSEGLRQLDRKAWAAYPDGTSFALDLQESYDSDQVWEDLAKDFLGKILDIEPVNRAERARSTSPVRLNRRAESAAPPPRSLRARSAEPAYASGWTNRDRGRSTSRLRWVPVGTRGGEAQGAAPARNHSRAPPGLEGVQPRPPSSDWRQSHTRSPERRAGASDTQRYIPPRQMRADAPAFTPAAGNYAVA